MRRDEREQKRTEAQELMWNAMDCRYSDSRKAIALCQRALRVYSDCVDALTMLAEIESSSSSEFLARLRLAVEAGRRDLGPAYFTHAQGEFWVRVETRPFMRAMCSLAFALLDQQTPVSTDEAVSVFKEMLELNPNDNQGVRDWLGACYLERKQYVDAEKLFGQYGDDGLAAPMWSRVLLAHAVGEERLAQELLAEARRRNGLVERLLLSKKRPPRSDTGGYSPGDEREAVYCLDMLKGAWDAHPDAKEWLQAQ